MSPTRSHALAVPVATAAGTARARMYAAPAAGRGVSSFSTWARHVPADVDLWGVRLPGRESAWLEPPVETIDTAAARLAQEIEEHCRTYGPAPLVLYGHSLGAYVAHATARAVEHRHPVGLVVAGAGAPLGRPAVQHHLLSDDALTQKLRGLGATPREILDDPELRATFLPLLRADFRLAETYSPPPERLRCPITAYAASDDTDVPVEDVRSWQLMTRGRFSLHETTGGHFFPDQQTGRILTESLTTAADTEPSLDSVTDLA